MLAATNPWLAWDTRRPILIQSAMVIRAYKLFRKRKNGTIGPLFINRRQVIPIGQWLKAEDHPTKGYARRPGWHAARTPHAPHLSTKGRTWYEVEVKDAAPLKRPASQGSEWLIARSIRVLKEVA